MDTFARCLDFGERLNSRIRRAIASPIDDDEFDALAIELFRLQANAIPTLRNLAARRGLDLKQAIPRSRLPAIPTAMFKELDLSCIPDDRRAGFFLSSGTTADARSRHWHCAESLALYETSLMTWFSACVPAPDHEFVSLTPPAATVPNSSLVHMFDQIGKRRRGRAGSFMGEVTEDGAWEVRFDELMPRLRDATRPILLVGTAFSFVHVLDELQRRDIEFDLPAGSRLLETGGYKGRSRVLPKQELHQRMSKRFGVPQEAIICEYGMSELGAQAYDTEPRGRDGGRMFRFPSWARCVITSPESGTEVPVGEAGILRILDLTNTFSVMCVQTEDLAVRLEDGFELVGRLTEAEPRGCSLMAA